MFLFQEGYGMDVLNGSQGVTTHFREPTKDKRITSNQIKNTKRRMVVIVGSSSLTQGATESSKE